MERLETFIASLLLVLKQWQIVKDPSIITLYIPGFRNYYGGASNGHYIIKKTRYILRRTVLIPPDVCSRPLKFSSGKALRLKVVPFICSMKFHSGLAEL